MVQSTRFRQLAQFNLVYLIAVILWGAWVRISGAGAGCGAHWPSCHGEIIPLSPSVETLIEYTHRLSSGLSLPLALLVLFFAFRLYPQGHGVRWASVGALVFLISEAAVGAGLVKFELVAGDASMARAITASAHLINTFALTAFAALVLWWSQRPYSPQSLQGFRSHRVKIGLGGILLVCMMGAVTALGDTLFPTSVFTEQGLLPKLAADLSGGTHFLVHLRIIHPILAVICSVYLFWMVNSFQTENRWSVAVNWTLGFQLLLGVFNILLGAPGWMQILHLLTALILWLSLLAFALSFAPQTAESSA